MHSQQDQQWMRRALELARRGEGSVEPNPMVGCVIARDDQLLGEGWHQQFGGPHAEILALRQAGAAAEHATLYVTLEPCAHHGKTPPCTEAVLQSGVSRIVVAQRDPFAQVNGQGIQQLVNAGRRVEVGLLAEEAQALNAPYRKLQRTGQPWVIGKWAMSLDGKIATREGHSQWISNESARRRVHQLRGRMDAILVGKRTALLDNPRLTARPSGPRVALRVVVDSRATLGLDSELVKSAPEVPLLLAVGPDASDEHCRRLAEEGCEILVCPAASHADRLGQLLDALGRRAVTNLLVEGGGELLGSLQDRDALDEVHVFLAPRIIGGAKAPSPIQGIGAARMQLARNLQDPQIEVLEDNVYIHGHLAR